MDWGHGRIDKRNPFSKPPLLCQVAIFGKSRLGWSAIIVLHAAPSIDVSHDKPGLGIAPDFRGPSLRIAMETPIPNVLLLYDHSCMEVDLEQHVPFGTFRAFHHVISAAGRGCLRERTSQIRTVREPGKPLITFMNSALTQQSRRRQFTLAPPLSSPPN
jgi:hypothetical protein